jgi:hypothetical protein
MAEPQKKRYRKNKRNLDAFMDLYKPTADELSQYIINLPGEVKRELYFLFLLLSNFLSSSMCFIFI